MEDGFSLAGNLLDQARAEVLSLRSLAERTDDKPSRYARLRLAAIVSALIEYGQDRDKEIERLVRECGLLRAKMEGVHVPAEDCA